MNKSQSENRSGRRVPTEAERRIAARIRVNADQARKVDTPQWIKDLAKAS
ncbi:hypothetical protein SAMN04489806_1090 [Paramicrobacterium humi]|uniref:Uncharacterized protein n=1 Tax=Paramicrobacterium humi TaxID=640635 RepID=A0A1H4KBQ2_9MICO|nr:hypothetical protein [Microbacterium humi]SEB55458.1 hypothetical protein SAMN04489806_1090 [Microbacterium humi]